MSCGNGIKMAVNYQCNIFLCFFVWNIFYSKTFSSRMMTNFLQKDTTHIRRHSHTNHALFEIYSENSNISQSFTTHTIQKDTTLIINSNFVSGSARIIWASFILCTEFLICLRPTFTREFWYFKWTFYFIIIFHLRTLHTLSTHSMSKKFIILSIYKTCYISSIFCC